MQNQKSALGMEGNVTALIGYIVGIIALVLIFIEKDNKFVRFHALQSVLWSVGYWIAAVVFCIVVAVLGVVASMVSSTLGGIVWGLFALLSFLLWLPWVAGLIYGAIKSYGGNMTKLPLVGNFAEKWT
jgi:uncharacterized membrane protein